MEIKVPAWLTEEFIQKTLEHGKRYQVIIDDMRIDMPVPKGNNYATEIVGVKVEYRRSNDLNRKHTKSFIMKLPITGPMYEILFKCGIIEKEPMVYKELLPKLRSILCENIDDEDDDETDDNLLAKSYFSAEKNIVILEDLKVKGYKMVVRQEQLDFDHSVLALKSLAKFHAGSVVLHERDPEFIEKIGAEVLFNDGFKETYSSFLNSNFNIISRKLGGQPDTEKFVKWFEENKGRFWDLLVDEVSKRENEFNVLNHGDFWLTNMMFKYDSDNNPVKNIPLDLQACRYASPVIDYLYFLYSSVQEPVKDERSQELINVYLEELNSSLEKYGSTKRLEKSEFINTLNKRKYFQIFVTIGMFPLVLAKPKDTQFLDMKELSVEDLSKTENNPFASYFENEIFWETFRKRLKEFEASSAITV